jgi:hypothetical protein
MGWSRVLCGAWFDLELLVQDTSRLGTRLGGSAHIWSKRAERLLAPALETMLELEPA